MNRIVPNILLLLFGLQLMAQTSETRNLEAFETVSVSQGIEAYLSKGSSESVRIEIDGNIELDEVLTEIDGGGNLRIHLDGNNYRNVEVEVYLTYVTLEGLKASSAGSIEVLDKVTCNCSFEVDVSSAGEIEVNVRAEEASLEASSAGNMDIQVEADEIEAAASSAGDIDIVGRAGEFEAKVSSSGDISAYDLTCDKADLRASSGGSIKVSVEEEIVARASSGGSISYRGNPQYADKQSSSGGSIRKQ
jgi:hypothetical protein